MLFFSSYGSFPPPAADSLADAHSSSHQADNTPPGDHLQSRRSSVSSHTVGCGTGCNGWFNQLSALLNATKLARPAISGSSTPLLTMGDNVSSDSQEFWRQFFSSQFKHPAFNPDGESRKIDSSAYQNQKKEYLSQLRKFAKGSPYIYVPFDDLPECRAGSLSPGLVVREVCAPPRHVSLSLVRATLHELLEILREEKGPAREVHLDFGRRPAADGESALHAGNPVQERDAFHSFPLLEILNAMAHFGTLAPENAHPGIRNIPGLKLTADLSGLKIEHPNELPHLHNLIIRSTIAGLHIDLSLIDQQAATWTALKKMLVAPDANTLHDLTLSVSGGGWSDGNRTLLSNAMKERRGMGKPLTVTVDGQRFEPI